MSSTLQTFDNIYADLSQSAYPDMPKPFAIEELEGEDRKIFMSGKSIPFDFSKAYKGIPGGQAPDVNYKLYLQPA